MPQFKDRPVQYKSFFLFPEGALLEMAQTYLFQISSYNDANVYAEGYGVSVMRDGGHTCVVAERGSLSINFASAMMRGIIIGDSEAILDEAHRCMALDEEYLPSAIRLYDDLERESIRYMDSFAMPGAGLKFMFT